MVSLGVDLGKVRDPSVIAMVWQPDTFERTMHLGTGQVISQRRTGPSALVFLEKIRLGTPYVHVVERVRWVARHERLGPGRRLVAVDATGVGIPVVEMLRSAKLGCELRPVTITGGMGEGYSHGIYSVAKTDLISGLRASLEMKTLEIAKGLALWPELRKQLLGFGGNGPDDMVLALALAFWGLRK